jgi:RNA polymerase sigma factor (sigma-70 family)
MDSDWLGRLVDRHAAALELFARQWCDTPEDVVQEAFVKLAAQRTPPENPAAWLFRVVRNGALNAALAARRRRRHETDAAAESTGWFQAERSVTSPGALDPENAAAELRSLPLEQREVIVAHLWGGLSFQEIAIVSGCSASTAHRLYTAGLSMMRERLGVTCRKNRPIRS